MAEEIFIPDHRIQSFDDLAQDVHAREYTDELVARASFMPVAVVILAAERGESLPMVIRARIRMDTGQVARLCREAINKLLTVNGPSSFATARMLQHFWRDSEVASRHALAEPEIAKLLYGRALFGMYEPISPY